MRSPFKVDEHRTVPLGAGDAAQAGLHEDDNSLTGGCRPDSIIPGIVGYEYDTINKTCQTPPLTMLFKYSTPDQPDAEAVRYTARSGARVFSSGSIRFATALDDLTGHADRRLQQFMRNALNDISQPPPGG